MLAAILAAVAVTDVDPGPFHCRFTVMTLYVDVISQAHDRGNREGSRRRMQYIAAVVFLDKDRAAKPQADSTSDTDRAERLVRKVQKQYSSCKQNSLLLYTSAPNKGEDRTNKLYGLTSRRTCTALPINLISKLVKRKHNI